MEGIMASQTVFIPAKIKNTYIKKQKKNQWIMIIECILTERNYLPPGIIWQGK